MLSKKAALEPREQLHLQLQTESDNFIPNEAKSFLVSQKLGSKGYRKSIIENQGRENITPSATSLRSFYQSSALIDPLHSYKASCIEAYESKSDSWLYHLVSGSNILLYGIGSKSDILHSFGQKLSGQDTLLLDGSQSSQDYSGTEKLVKSLIDYICKSILRKPELLSRHDNLIHSIGLITGR
jgi:hypothetical protein